MISPKVGDELLGACCWKYTIKCGFKLTGEILYLPTRFGYVHFVVATAFV